MIYSRFGSPLQLISKEKDAAGQLVVKATCAGMEGLRSYLRSEMTADGGNPRLTPRWPSCRRRRSELTSSSDGPAHNGLNERIVCSEGGDQGSDDRSDGSSDAACDPGVQGREAQSSKYEDASSRSDFRKIGPTFEPPRSITPMPPA